MGISKSLWTNDVVLWTKHRISMLKNKNSPKLKSDTVHDQIVKLSWPQAWSQRQKFNKWGIPFHRTVNRYTVRTPSKVKSQVSPTLLFIGGINSDNGHYRPCINDGDGNGGGGNEMSWLRRLSHSVRGSRH